LMLDCLGVSGRSADPSRAEAAAQVFTGDGAAVDPVLAASERLVDMVHRECAAGPVLLVAEDLHWADTASLQVWHRLGQAVARLPLLLVGTCRPVPRRVEVQRLRAALVDDDAVLVRLGPLDETAVAALAGRLLAAAPGPLLRAALAQAGGNPLDLRELVDALAREELVSPVDGGAELRPASTSAGGGGIVPRSLAGGITRRLGFRDAGTRAVLRLAALLGSEFAVADLALASVRMVAELVAVLDEAVAAGVLTDAGARMAFRHELIRQALRAEVPPAVRAALHEQVARRLAEAGAAMGRVAQHLLAAPGGGVEEWMGRWLAGLPEATLLSAPEVAAELLTRALDQSRPGEPRWAVLAGRLASVLFWLGRNEQVEPVAGAVLRTTTDPDLAARMA